MSNALASGRIWHSRQAPGRHAFSYRLTYLWCDLDHLDQGRLAAPWVSAGPGGIFQLRREDHLRGTTGGWRAGIEEWLDRAGLERCPTMHILTLPRVLGRTFNPVSFWIGGNEDRRVVWIVAEVNNTFGGRHLYPLDVKNCVGGRMEWIESKAFPVSPFHDLGGQYRFRLEVEPQALRLWIDLERPGEPVFRTGMDLILSPLSASSVLKEFPRLLGSVVLTVPRILWHAARIHFGGKARFHPPQAQPSPWTIHRGLPVLLQRLFANPWMGRLWSRLGHKTTRTRATTGSATWNSN